MEEGGEEFCFAVGAVLARVEFVAAHFLVLELKELSLSFWKEGMNINTYKSLSPQE